VSRLRTPFFTTPQILAPYIDKLSRNTITHSLEMIEHPDELDELLQKIMADYEANLRFFADHRLPEYAVLDELALDDRELALFLTFTCVTNHIHDGTKESKQTDGPTGLWQICGNLWEQHHWIFFPEELVEEEKKDDLKALFGSIEIMDHRDQEWWYRTAKTLSKHWEGDPQQLLANPQPDAKSSQGRYDAPSIERALNDYDFPALSGRKIRPLWLRLMHEEVHELNRIEAISIPVDFHIVGITNRLSGGDAEFDRFNEDHKETLRQFWQLVCRRTDLIPVELDKPLWLLHKHWHDSGQKYVTQRVSEISESSM